MTHSDQKPEEHTVYVASEETMTDVRERIVGLPYEHFVLVVPLQTELRHAIVWRVLARWAQEQGKDIAVASSDKQIRALARSVHFVLIPSTLPSEQRPRTTQSQSNQRKRRGQAG